VLVHTETNGALLFCEAVAIHRIDKDTIAIVGKKGEDVQDRLRLAHMSVCKAENERMREVFNMRTYKEGDQWTAQREQAVNWC
jgi:hypothetical protein